MMMTMNTVITLVLLICCRIATAKQSADKRFCKDEAPYSQCNFWNKLGACKYEAYFSLLAVKCPKTCNLCTYNLENKIDDCKDKDNVLHCEYLKEKGACESHADIMGDRCANTCKLCDASLKCAKKECNYNEVCILDEKRQAQCSCPKYCVNKKNYVSLGQICGSDGKTYTNFCNLQHQACKENNNITVTKYGLCDTDVPCEDRKLEKETGMCDQWKSQGFCDETYYDNIMKKYCKKTCGFCEKKVPFQRIRGDCDKKALSPFGCCWDLSFKPDPKSGKKCPVCSDRFDFCTRFIEQCNKPKNFNFMKGSCAVTCGYCVPEKKPVVQLKVFTNKGQKSYTTQHDTKTV